MNKQKGFTLIELLVVIAIIALLMSILIPALAKVRKQAKSVMCQSKLHQWSFIFSMYTGDNDGSFPESDAAIPTSGYDGAWITALSGYLEKDDYSLWLCPMTTKTQEDIGFTSLAAWWDYTKGGIFPEDAIGGYGINSWVYNRGGGDYWKNANVRGANNIPVFLDACYPGGKPKHTNVPPLRPGNPNTGGQQIQRFCLDRHDGTINGLFMDWSVKTIPLKCLWKLKWSRAFEISRIDVIEWPPWMRRFKACNY